MDDQELDELLGWAVSCDAESRPLVDEVDDRLRVGELCREVGPALVITECPGGDAGEQASTRSSPDPYSELLGCQAEPLERFIGWGAGEVLADCCGEPEYPSWRTRRVLDELYPIWEKPSQSWRSELSRLAGTDLGTNDDLLRAAAQRILASESPEPEPEATSDSSKEEGLSIAGSMRRVKSRRGRASDDETGDETGDETDEETSRHKDAVQGLIALRKRVGDALNALKSDFTDASWLERDIEEVITSVKTATPEAVWTACDDYDESASTELRDLSLAEISAAAESTRKLLDRLEEELEGFSGEYEEAEQARDELMGVREAFDAVVADAPPAKKRRVAAAGGVKDPEEVRRLRAVSDFDALFRAADADADDTIQPADDLKEATEQAWKMVERELRHGREADEASSILEDWTQYEALRLEQHRTDLVIPAPAFATLCDEILSDADQYDCLKFDQEAYAALQAAAEDHLARVFENAGRRAIHAGREELAVADFKS